MINSKLKSLRILGDGMMAGGRPQDSRAAEVPGVFQTLAPDLCWGSVCYWPAVNGVPTRPAPSVDAGSVEVNVLGPGRCWATALLELFGARGEFKQRLGATP
ncbi:hypothetical protein SNOG_12908 [Parastagonospora nodorum SN15]|uniref:Uncharacterized protein n=1 Tax=Phaeosphaeria nodorum (strain SN15 / ATCC MYA-4574 / FGSC 10173) TaxID=321614 RepID=Q0U5Q6_PHANO|nr:hypothetical protein SNOG_12908 [Parastagonospora nodorum SN15]EAT79708.1 hypothetical protein SNOG_12908 [Parastagonospora nodorum SN15]